MGEGASLKRLEKAQTPAEARALRLLRALGSPVRLRIVEILAERKDCTAAQLAEELGLAQSSLFEHLTALRESGVVEVGGDGPNRYYGLDPSVLYSLAAFLGGVGGRTRAPASPAGPASADGTVSIRDASVDDAPAIARIYNGAIEDRTVTLETELRSPEERAEWLASHDGRHPVLLAVDAAGVAVGWASLNRFNPRAVYDHVADLSLYVARESHGRGVGDALMTVLETRARALGYHKMVLAALPTNAPGMRLYERQGFATVGTYHEQGMLDGRWVDVVVMEKILG
jgi:L-amino acid N-acyltransferase YncA